MIDLIEHKIVAADDEPIRRFHINFATQRDSDFRRVRQHLIILDDLFHDIDGGSGIAELDGDIFLNCLKEMKDFLPSKRKLTKENVMRDLLRLYKSNSREAIEKVIKNERPLVKRFISQAYDGEYSGLPIQVAGIVAQYVEDSI